MSAEITTLSPGHLAILRAVATGRAEVTCSCEPDLYVDGLPCCNQLIVHQLAHAGYLAASRPGHVGQRVPATLTDTGLRVLAALTPKVEDAA